MRIKEKVIHLWSDKYVILANFAKLILRTVAMVWLIMKISWRNLWRNKRRSLITLGAVIAGLWGLVLIYGANNGMLVGIVNTSILANNAHIQIHADGYHDDPDINTTIEDFGKILDAVKGADHVVAAAPRTEVRGMLSTAHASSGITLVGIDPEAEARVTSVDNGIIEGRYFEPGEEKGILIGEGLAEKLKTKTGKKIVIYARGPSKDLTALGVRVTGVFETGTDAVDKFYAFVPLSYFQERLDLDGKAHEIAIRIDDNKNLEAAKESVVSKLPKEDGLEVLTWREMFAFLVQMMDFAAIGNYAMLIVVGIAMALGIANTMIMSVFERFRELGIMKAVGTGPGQIFLMILVESVLLSLTGLVVGSALGYVSIEIWGHYGLDLAAFSDSLHSVGMPSIIYPEVYLQDWTMTWIAVVVMAVGACIYPAIKAARQKPVEAMRM